MKKVFFLLSCILFTSLTSCYENFDDKVETTKSPKFHTLTEDLEIVKKFMTIDTVNYSYGVVITDSIMLADNIYEENLIHILADIDELNKKVKESIEKGEVTTLSLSTKEGFKSFTIGKNDRFSFRDTKTTRNVAATRGYPIMSFYAGNWSTSFSEFEASDHVTSYFAVGYARGYWQANINCSTGTSSYGDTFTTYGTGSTHGQIQRYWWLTSGESGAPYRWRFDANSPVGGEASGDMQFNDTPK